MINVSESWTVPAMLSRAIQFLLRIERQGAVIFFLLNPWIYYGKIPASTLKYGLENPINIKNSITAYIKQINDNNLITFIHHSP